MMHRLFVALRPPAPVRLALLERMGGVANARWQADDQLHLTLRYIGEVPRPVAEDIAVGLSAARSVAFTLQLQGIGSFDRKGRIDQLWAGVSPHDEVTALHHKIDHQLVRLGLPTDGRAFLPHITLARLGKTGGDISGFAIQHAALSSPPFAVEWFGLYESILTSTAAHYELVARYPLSPA